MKYKNSIKNLFIELITLYTDIVVKLNISENEPLS